VLHKGEGRFQASSFRVCFTNKAGPWLRSADCRGINNNACDGAVNFATDDFQAELEGANNPEKGT
jgi:hypothetical protein